MDITYTALHPLFAAECSGVDVSQPLTPQSAAAIHEGMDRYAVLVFRRSEPLSTAQQIAFTTSLGDLEPPYTRINPDQGARLPDPALADQSNLGPDGRILPREDRRRLFVLGNRLWHSDSSYKRIPAKYSLLCAHVVPPEGGDTEFADMRSAWDTLDDALKEEVRDLVVEHSRIYSKGVLGFPFTEQEVRDFEPVRQPLVRVHPVTGRRSLFLSSHAGRIVGWPVAEGLLLLRELTEHATQPAFVYRHRWRVGDLVMWDNRTTMHRARLYDDRRYPRDLRRTTLTAGEPAMAAA